MRELVRLAVVQCVLLAIAIAIGVSISSQQGLSPHGWAKVLGGAIAIGAIFGSFELIFKHLKYFSCPEQQRHIVRILFMIPIYAVDSWASLMAPEASEFINPFRDCYEAYVLYSFIKLLEAYIGDLEALLPQLADQPIDHLAPFCCFKPMIPDLHVMRRLNQGVMQYMLIRPVLVVFETIFKIADKGSYEGGVVDYTRAYAYVVFVLTISQTVALYGLVYIYLILHKKLAKHNPLGKFISIKAVVFFSFWQTCLFQILEAAGVIQPAFGYDAVQVSGMLSDFCLIVEMLGFSALHLWVFPYEQYRLNSHKGLWDRPWLYNGEEEEQLGAISGVQHRKREAFKETIKQSDVASDVSAHFLHRGKPAQKPDTTIPPESPDLEQRDAEEGDAATLMQPLNSTV